MASRGYQISLKSVDRFKFISGGHRQAGDLISLLSFLESRLKTSANKFFKFEI
jgi:hypothetical protein